MHVPPLPKNMHPVHNLERRRQRAKAIHNRFKNSDDVVYVDAADYSNRDAMTVAVVDRQGHLVASGTVFAPSTEVGEEVAIALALASSRAKFIVSDSKSAVRNFARGRVSSEALRIMAGFDGTRLRGSKLYGHQRTLPFRETRTLTTRLEVWLTETTSPRKHPSN